jgi:hypothetical protein
MTNAARTADISGEGAVLTESPKLHEMPWRTLLAIQAFMAFVAIVGARATGLTVEWSGALSVVGVILATLAVWAYFVTTRPSELERRVADGCLAFGILLALGLTAPPSQYVAVALNRPLIDPWLSRADALLGLSVEASAAWLQVHPWVHRVLTLAYTSLLVQFALIGPLLAGMGRRDRLHEYLFHFHVCSLITVTCLAMWPAAGVFQYEQFTPPFAEARFIEHFNLTRAGTPPVLVFGDMVGMVSFPSFHLAGAWMITWALRQTRFFWPVLVLNVLLTLGTFATGAHYVTDGFGTAVMGIVSVALWRRIGGEADTRMASDRGVAVTAAAPRSVNLAETGTPDTGVGRRSG